MTPEEQQPRPRRARGAVPIGGEVAPGYRVVEHLSRARDLDVYDVWSEARECRCVAKVLRPDRLDNERTRGHLLREGRLLLRLTHPHIVRAYELIEKPHPVLVLETLTGATLSWLLDELRDRGRRMPIQDVVHLGLHLTSALGYLHRHDFLHLDVKPSNVVAETRLAKLIDLSVGRPPGPLRGKVGSRPWMSPEQLRSEVATEATDVWGLAMVLYEAAAGDRPFKRNGRRVRPQLKERAPPLRTLRRVPRPLAEVVDGGLEPDQNERPSLQEITAALNSLV